MCVQCTLYPEYCNVFIRKDYFSLIKSLVRRKHDLVGHLVLPQIFSLRTECLVCFWFGWTLPGVRPLF